MASSQGQRLEGKWRQLKGKIQEIWGDISGDELDRYQGKFTQLVGTIEEKTGKARARIRGKLEDLAEEIGYSFE